MSYSPKTGQPCHCKRGQQRDNCPDCEGTGMRIDFKAVFAAWHDEETNMDSTDFIDSLDQAFFCRGKQAIEKAIK